MRWCCCRPESAWWGLRGSCRPMPLRESFRCACGAREPGIRSWMPCAFLDSGFGAERRPGMTKGYSLLLQSEPLSPRLPFHQFALEVIGEVFRRAAARLADDLSERGLHHIGRERRV